MTYQQELTPIRPTSDRYPGLTFHKGDPSLKKTDPLFKDRIESDDSKFDIFDCPEPLVADANIKLLSVKPFDVFSKFAASFDIEAVGADGGECKFDGTDVIIAIGIKYQGKHYVACNPLKTEEQLLRWFYDQLAKLDIKVLYGQNIYGFDLGVIKDRGEKYGIKCPWKRKAEPWNTYRWSNAVVMGRSLELPAWECSKYELIDTYPQVVLYDGLVRKLDSYSLKNAVIGFGLRKDRRIEIGADVYKYWADGDIATIVEYLKFDLDDAELLWDFLIPQRYFMKSYMDWDLTRITTTGTGSWWNQFLCKKTGLKPDRGATCHYQGALTYYHGGLYKNCVKLDFAGLYPSIMLSWLICSEKDTEKVSLKILAFLLDYRLKLKALALDGDKDADGQQMTAKVLANSLYGLWNTRGLNFNDSYAGAAITAYGRNLARYMIKFCVERGVETVGCFTGETEVLTIDGNRRIDSLLNGESIVLNKDKNWVPVQFASYGTQEIVELTVKNGNKTKIVRTTANHKWLTVNGEVKTTDQLLANNIPVNLASRPDDENEYYRMGVVHGIVYGDGQRLHHATKNEGSRSIHRFGFNVQLVKEKGYLLEHLTKCALDGSITLYQARTDNSTVESIKVTLRSDIELKELPDKASPSYLLGFFRGLLATDGNVSGKDGCPDISGQKETIDFVKSILPIIGVEFSRINVSNKAGRTTIIRGRECTQKTDCYRIFMSKNSLYEYDFLREFHSLKFMAKFRGGNCGQWTAMHVKATGEFEEVYCCVEPDTHTFTLSDSILTKNCDTDGIYIHKDKDSFTTDAEREDFFTRLTEELNDNLPGCTKVDFEDVIPLLYVPENEKKGAAEILADKIEFIETVSPDTLSPGLSKNYLMFTLDRKHRKKTGETTYKLTKKGKFKKRDKSWLESGLIIEWFKTLFNDGETVANRYLLEIRNEIASGNFDLAKLQKTVLVASTWKEFPKYGFPVGTKPTIHYVWRGETSGKRVIKKVFVPSADLTEPYSIDYYLARFDDLTSTIPNYYPESEAQLTLV